MALQRPFANKTAHKEKPLRRRLLEEREMPRALVVAARIGLFFVVPVVAHILFPLGRDMVEVNAREGEISAEEVIAPFSFPIRRDAKELERARDEAGRAVPPVLDVDATHASRSVQKLRRLSRELMRPPSENLPPEELRASLQRSLGINLSPASLAFLRTPPGQEVIDLAASYIDTALSAPIVESGVAPYIAGHSVINARRGTSDFYRPTDEVKTLSEARAAAESAAVAVGQDNAAAGAAFLELILPFVVINASYNHQETVERAEEAKREVPEVIGVVQRGERIVDSHERVTAEQVLKLKSMEAHGRELAIGGGLGGGLFAAIGRLGAVSLLVLAFLTYLRFQQQRVYADFRQLGLITTLVVLLLILTWLLVDHFGQPALLVPVAVLPLLSAILVARGVALFLAFLAPVLLVGLKALSTEFLVASSVAGVGAVLAAENLKRRHSLYQPVLVVALVNVLTVLTMGLSLREPLGAVAAKGSLGILNAGIVGAVAIVLLPILEKVFRITTNFTLIELLDRNHPLLKRMVIEAPGTFHHSMLVAELSREAAEAVGGNQLLAQVGAYYHDIGKMQMPDYFVENQTGKNRHDRLSPSMSCHILRSHVRDGMQMAREAGLPAEIIDFIPEHHGTNLMSYFYHKAQDRDPEVEEPDFRYQGPRPQNKETAIVMLADSVEATARSLDDPTPGRIRTVVKRIFDKRLEDGQLDGSALTLSDLAKVRDSFITVLDRFFHGRIQYPEAALRSRREADGTVGGPQGEMAPIMKTPGRADGRRDARRAGRRGIALPDGDESLAVFVHEEDENAGARSESAAAAGRGPRSAQKDHPDRSRQL